MSYIKDSTRFSTAALSVIVKNFKCLSAKEWLNLYKPIVLYSCNKCVHAQPLQSCPTLCDPMNCSPPGSSLHGISQTRILEQVAISSSKRSSRVSCISFLGRQVLYHRATREAKNCIPSHQKKKKDFILGN